MRLDRIFVLRIVMQHCFMCRRIRKIFLSVAMSCVSKVCFLDFTGYRPVRTFKTSRKKAFGTLHVTGDLSVCSDISDSCISSETDSLPTCVCDLGDLTFASFNLGELVVLASCERVCKKILAFWKSILHCYSFFDVCSFALERSVLDFRSIALAGFY